MSRDPSATRGQMISRALRRRCPRCGTAAFASWFTMHDHCPGCGLHFEREPGYWVGAVTINTVVIFATFLVTFGGLTLLTWPNVPWVVVLIVTLIVNLVVPIVFYPLSKTVWLALEMSWHPLEPDEIEAAAARL
ncbi:MAG TPA: DUF983 domain-containing protein [Acidimicrobiia bacterium]|nr:DUF983 domain-containing protein [Acidimicrobiia bacterium]